MHFIQFQTEGGRSQPSYNRILFLQKQLSPRYLPNIPNYATFRRVADGSEHVEGKNEISLSAPSSKTNVIEERHLTSELSLNVVSHSPKTILPSSIVHRTNCHSWAPCIPSPRIINHLQIRFQQDSGDWVRGAMHPCRSWNVFCHLLVLRFVGPGRGTSVS